MGILWAFAPFIAFAVVDRLVGSHEGLVAGACVSAFLVARELVRKRSPRLLEVGSLVLFAGLAAYAYATNADWSVIGVRLRVDLGLLVLVLLSMAVKRPFTLQYAREQTPAEVWGNPEFIRTSYVITAAWALAFLVIVIADLLMLTQPQISIRVGIVITILALLGAVKFTHWYPHHKRSPG